MTTATMENPVKLRAEGIRLLNEGLGPHRARQFIDNYFDGEGDSLAEKKARGPWTDAELDEAMALAEINANTNVWRGEDLPTE